MPGWWRSSAAPESHEDDPERALRAALRSVRDVGAYGEGLSLRIGVETGHAVVGPIGAGRGAHYDAVGEVSLIAAALQSAAKPTSVLVGPATRRAVQGIFEWGATQEVPIPPGGTSVVAGYLERIKVRPAGEVARRRLAGAAPLLGTGLSSFQSFAKRSSRRPPEEGSSSSCWASAGLGKTRLVQECRKLFMTWVGAASGRLPLWLEGRAASYQSNTPYGLYQRLMFSWVGVVSGRKRGDGVGEPRASRESNFSWAARPSSACAAGAGHGPQSRAARGMSFPVWAPKLCKEPVSRRSKTFSLVSWCTALLCLSLRTFTGQTPLHSG